MKYSGILSYSDLEGGIWTLEDGDNSYHLAIDDSLLSGLRTGDKVELEAEPPGFGIGMMGSGSLAVEAITKK